MTPVDENTFLILCKDKDESSFVYKYNGGAKKMSSSSVKFHTIEFSEGTTWLAGDTLAIRSSVDTGKTWKYAGNSSFVDWKKNWQSDVSDLICLYVKDDKPAFAIGTDDLFSGNVYWDNCEKSSQKKFGLNDMIVLHDSAYIAGYGSVIFTNDLGNTQTLEDIGGENFMSICSNDAYIFVCSYSGKIYRTKVGSHSWDKMYANGKKLLFIEANQNGDVVAVGESRNILISNDNGKTWREESYNEGNKISCLKVINNEFYIGTEKGTIIKLTEMSLE